MKIKILVGIGLLVFGGAFAQTQVPKVAPPRVTERNLSYRVTSYSGLTFVRPLSNVWMTWSESGTRASSLTDSGYKFVVNGGYFTWNKSGTFIPAGKLQIGSTGIASTVNSNLDKNLGVTVLFNRKTQKRGIDRKDLVIPRPNIASFYVGPLLIQSGVINTGVFIKTSHWLKPAERTFIVIDRNQKAVFGSYTGKITLPALLSGIVESTLFTGQYHVINLDGGSSTSIRTEKIRFGTRGKLPWRFGVR